MKARVYSVIAALFLMLNQAAGIRADDGDDYSGNEPTEDHYDGSSNDDVRDVRSEPDADIESTDSSTQYEGDEGSSGDQQVEEREEPAEQVESGGEEDRQTERSSNDREEESYSD